MPFTAFKSLTIECSLYPTIEKINADDEDPTLIYIKVTTAKETQFFKYKYSNDDKLVTVYDDYEWRPKFYSNKFTRIFEQEYQDDIDSTGAVYYDIKCRSIQLLQIYACHGEYKMACQIKFKEENKEKTLEVKPSAFKQTKLCKYFKTPASWHQELHTDFHEEPTF